MSFQPRSCEGLQAERGVLALEVHRRQLAARRAACGSTTLGSDVTMWRCFRTAGSTGRGDTRGMCAHQPTAESPLAAASEQAAEPAAPSAFDDNAPGCSPYARRPRRSPRAERPTEAADEQQDDQRVARVREPRAGASPGGDTAPSRRRRATITATMFWSDVIAAQIAPSSGHDEDGLDESTGHDVGGPDREEDEAPEDRQVHDRRARVPEHPRLHERVARRGRRRGLADARSRTAGLPVANTRRWRAIASAKYATAP